MPSAVTMFEAYDRIVRSKSFGRDRTRAVKAMAALQPLLSREVVPGKRLVRLPSGRLVEAK